MHARRLTTWAAAVICVVMGTPQMAAAEAAASSVQPDVAPVSSSAPEEHVENAATAVITEPVAAETDTAAIAPETIAGAGSTVIETGGGLRVVGVTWDAEGGEAEVRLRSHDGDRWSPWEEVHAESLEAGEVGRGGTEPFVVDADRIEIVVTAHGDESPGSVEVAVIDPGTSEFDAIAASEDIAALTTLSSAMVPRIRTRAEWGADETIRLWRPEAGRVTGAVVHHTAGTNSYTAEQVPAIIRGIYTYHAQERGWDDIGYNVLVDQFGRAWEGRYGGLENPVIGAHATGANANMFGISVMGNFETAEVPQAAFQTVAEVIGWKLSLHGVDSTTGTAVGPGGAAVARIVGHRDVGSTACPGTRFYARLGELRSMVAAYQRQNPPRPVAFDRMVRVAGADRYATSVESARWGHPRTSRTVFIATGADYADALAAGPAAAASNSPVLLVQQNRIPASVIEELERFEASRIYVLGGVEAVSASVVTQLRQYAGTVQRITGADRYATSAQVSQQLYATSTSEVWVSSGSAYADALSGGPAAGRANAPMLLSRSDALPASTRAELRRLQPSRIVLVGGESALSADVRQEIAAAVPGATITRLSGANRYETSAAVAQHGWPGTAGRVYFATALSWPDALSGVSAAGASGAPLLLVRGTCAPAAIRESLSRLSPTAVFILGGRAAVADGALTRSC